VCTDSAKFQRHVQSYFENGVHTEIVVLHNTAEYGGSGGNGFAVVSHGNYASNVLAHEMGHSLFGLTDEYKLEESFDPDGHSGTSGIANLDDAGCPKWQDLMNTPSVGTVKCMAGKGKGDRYYADGDTFMDWCENPFGVVNERISCCKYAKLFGNIPAYCNKFNENGLNLQTFCNSDAARTIWGSSSMYQAAAIATSNYTREQKLMTQALDTQSLHYDFVEDPVGHVLEKDPDGSWYCRKSGIPLLPGMYLKDLVEGDAARGDLAAAEGRYNFGVTTGKRIIVTAIKGTTYRKLTFYPEQKVEAPPRTGPNDKPGEWDSTSSTYELPDINLILHEGEYCLVAELPRAD
jgi:hypothetical protein